MKLKNIFSLFSAVCVSAGLFCGCAENQNPLDPKNPADITIWHYYNGVQQEYFDHMIVEFNETVGHEQGIIVEARSKGTINELADSVLASLKNDVGAETPPDIFASYAETAYIADELGCVVDLSQYFTAEELAEYVDGYLEEGKFDDSQQELKIFPTAKSTEVMMLNQTDFQKFADAENISETDLSTWESLAETAEKYYTYTDNLTPDTPNDGKAFFGRDSVANYMIVGAKQLGMEFFTEENGELTLHTDEEVIRRLWDCYYVPYVKGYYFAQSRYRSDDAKIGEIIAMVCSSTGAVYFPDSVTIDDSYTYPIDSFALPIPNFEGCEPYAVQQGAGMVVTKSDPKTEYACSVFLKWITEQERNIDFAVKSGYLPVKKSANDFEIISEFYENDGADRQAMEAAVSEVNTYSLYSAKPFEKSTEVRDFLGNYIQDTAQTAYEKAFSRIQGGEERETVLEDYVSDKAFAQWYDDFVSGLQSASGIV